MVSQSGVQLHILPIGRNSARESVTYLAASTLEADNSGLALSDIDTDLPNALDKSVLPLSSSINSNVGGVTTALRSSGWFSVVESGNDSTSM